MKNIKDASEYEAYCASLLEGFVASLKKPYKRKPTKQDKQEWSELMDIDVDYIITSSGLALCERYKERLKKLGEAKYNDYVHIAMPYYEV